MHLWWPGTAHICAVLLTISRLLFIRRRCRYRQHRMHGAARILQCSAIVASLICLLVELFQLNARIAADPSPLIQGDVAPFEWAGVLIFIVSQCLGRLGRWKMPIITAFIAPCYVWCARGTCFNHLLTTAFTGVFTSL
jgi:hypothetical protein